MCHGSDWADTEGSDNVCIWAQEGLTVKTPLHEAENLLPPYKIRTPTEFSHKVDPMSQ